MKKIIDLNKEWFDKANELFVDFVKRGGDEYLKDLSFLNLKRDVYSALSNLIFHLADWQISSRLSDKTSSKDTSKQLEKFKTEIREIFNKFEVGRDYTNSGFVESMVDLVGRRIHSTSYRLFAKAKIAKLEKLMEEFWINFFELTKTNDSKSDQAKLNNLLEAFDKNINETIS